MRSTYLLLSLLVCLFRLPAQEPLREVRGVWIATVKNIDWPSRAGLPAQAQQQELISLLDSLQTHGFNTVILQIRPSGDAFYDSPIEPWSEWLTGSQGLPPRPYYDPLEFAVTEAHRRNMELHAWLNPFRVVMDADKNPALAASHVARRRPDWTLRYGNISYLDPGIPEARAYVMNVVADVVTRYDIDAIHFDDYFYPYKIAGEEFPDTASFRRYGGRFRDLPAWRRNNVDEFIRLTHDRIIGIKPSVKFGISPFAVWRNQADDPEGSATRAGITSYDALHADVRTWLRMGWIDYVAPQLYFSIGFAPADFAVLLDWWERNTFGKHLYIGHSPYKIQNNQDPNWNSPREIPRQVEAVRQNSIAQGSLFFSANWLNKNLLGWADSLRQTYYQSYTFPPAMAWIDNSPPLPPAHVDISSDKRGIELLWLTPQSEEAAYYCLYRTDRKTPPLPLARYRMAILREEGNYYLDEEVKFGRKYHYLVTARDRHHNESEPVMVSRRAWKWR